MPHLKAVEVRSHLGAVLRTTNILPCFSHLQFEIAKCKCAVYDSKTDEEGWILASFP